MEPDYVQAYLAAKWWIAVHIGIPVAIIGLAVFAFAKWAEYREDCSVNDEPDESEPRAGKTLGL